MTDAGRGRLLLLAATILTAGPAGAAPPSADIHAVASPPYRRAFAFFARQDYRSARIEALKALKADPKDRLARLLNARIAIELGAGVEGQTELEKARRDGVPIEKTHHLMAHAYELQDLNDQALAEADTAQVPPQFAAYAARVRGRADMKRGQPEQARGEFEQAVRLAPADVPTLIDRARFLMSTGDRAGAEREVDRLLTLSSASPAPLILKGDLVRARSGLAAAIPYFDQALKRAPASVEGLLERAATLVDLNREAAARADLKQLADVAPDHPLALYLTAKLETRAGHLQQAQGLLQRTKGSLDDYVPALLLQGIVSLKQGAAAAAIDPLSTALDKAPDDRLIRQMLAYAEVQSGDPAGAITTLRPIADAPDADAGVLSDMAQAFTRAGDTKSAQAYLQRALKAKAGSPALLNQLAIAQAAGGDTAAALSSLEQASPAARVSPQTLASTATIATLAGRFAEGRDLAAKLVAQAPTSPIGYNLRGMALLGLRDSRGAEADFRAAIQRDPKFTGARRNLAQLLSIDGRAAEARVQLLAWLQAEPTNPQAMLLMAANAAQSGNVAERLQWASQAVNASPTALAPRMELVKARIQAGQTDAAVSLARAIERDVPRDPAVIKAVGMASLAARNGVDAEAAFRRMLALVPNDPATLGLLARAQIAQGHLDVARQTYSDAFAKPRPGLEALYVDAISLAQNSNRVAEAQALVAKLRAAYPTSNLADILTGDAQLKVGRVADAIAAYQAARAVSFNRLAALKLASAYRTAGQLPQARGVLDAYTTGQPDDLVVRSALGEILMAQRQYKLAVTAFQGIVARHGETPDVLNNLAWSYHQIGDKRALATAEQALARAPGSPDAKDTLGSILIDTRADKVRGQTLIEQAVAARPADPELRYHLAVARVVNDRRSDALAEVNRALAVQSFPSRAGALALAKRLGR